MKIVRWGIVGCGNVCEVKSGPAFAKVDGSKLVAVMRRDAVKAKDYALRHGVEQWFTNADDIIFNPDIDAVYIATPPSSHAEYAIKALRAGKAVYVEKPMARNYAECQEMIRVAKETNQPLFVAHYRRALPYFLKVKELVDGKRIGGILAVNVRFYRGAAHADRESHSHIWRVDPEVAGGGYLFDLAPHTIDIIEYIAGKIDDVKGSATNLAGLYAAEDTITASFRFENGAVGSALWCFVTTNDIRTDTIEIIGTKGSLTFSTFEFTPIVLRAEGREERFAFKNPQHIQQPLIQTIVEELQGVGKCPSCPEEGARPSWVMDKILGRI